MLSQPWIRNQPWMRNRGAPMYRGNRSNHTLILKYDVQYKLHEVRGMVNAGNLESQHSTEMWVRCCFQAKARQRLGCGILLAQGQQ